MKEPDEIGIEFDTIELGPCVEPSRGTVAWNRRVEEDELESAQVRRAKSGMFG